MWKVKLRKVRATWYHYTENPQGGGFGSTHVGSKTAALTRATRNIPEGALYKLFIDDKLVGTKNHINPVQDSTMKRFNPLKPQSESSAPLTKARKAPAREPGATEFTTTLTENVEKNGLEIRFANRPADDVLAILKANGWFWSRRNLCWYTRNTPENREFAQRFLKPPSSSVPSPIQHPESSIQNPVSNVIPVQFTEPEPECSVPVASAECSPVRVGPPVWRSRLIRQN